ncbi:MAG: BrnA antitoxin family protein [Vicinamibacterales bacterium]
MRKNSSRPDAENPEWTEEDFRRARPALEVLPTEVVEAIRRYRGQRGPQKAATKELISLRVDRDVVDAFRATGRGWQTRATEALRAYAKKRLRSPGPSRRTKGRRETASARHA